MYLGASLATTLNAAMGIEIAGTESNLENGTDAASQVSTNFRNGMSDDADGGIIDDDS